MSADTLCMSCGLCCDGTFFGSVVVEEEERPRLERVRLRVIEQGGTPALAQPCTALRGCLCAAYAERPAACARYACTLRNAVSTGSENLDDALNVVARMHALLTTIRTAFDCHSGTSIWHRILALEEPTTADGRNVAIRDYGAAIDAVAELLELGRAKFEPRFAGGGSR